MKYFGKGSLSSWISSILHVAWHVVLVGSIVGTIVGAVLLVLLSIGQALTTDSPCAESKALTAITAEIARSPDAHRFEDVKDNFRTRFQKFRNGVQGKEKKDFETFMRLPVFVKILIFPYFWAVVVLLLIIIRKSRELFLNFKNNILFNRSNVALLSSISKFNIAFSIMTFSFSSLLASIFLLMACEVFKNGTVLQEEHDLTV